MAKNGKTGTSTNNCTSISTEFKKKLGAELELRRMGRGPTRFTGYRFNFKTLECIDDGTNNEQHWYWLTDYRDGNKKILRRAFTRLEAYKKNKFLEGTGKQWARRS
jgi:hypothetical protein